VMRAQLVDECGRVVDPTRQVCRGAAPGEPHN
jgi:hypothetical protein